MAGRMPGGRDPRPRREVVPRGQVPLPLLLGAQSQPSLPLRPLLVCLSLGALFSAALAAPDLLDTIIKAATKDCQSGPATWPGITCNGGHPVALNLSSRPLRSPIPGSISSLTALTLLDLSSCLLRGSFPSQLAVLTNLRILDLSRNSQLSGTLPLMMSALRQLQRLNLAGLQGVGGPIPDGLARLAQLTYLSLAATGLRGSLPSNFSLLTSLQVLDLRSLYGLTGSFPEFLGNLQGLTILVVTGADLDGPVPESISKLRGLRELDVSSNELAGSIPEALGALSHLSMLKLNGNFLTGSIPASLGKLLDLRTLALASNQLAGSIPETLGKLVRLQVLGLTGNQLWGTVPSALSSLTALSFLDLSSNLLSGTLPYPIGVPQAELHFDGNYFYGTVLGSPCLDSAFSAESNCLSSAFPCPVVNRDPAQCRLFCSTGVGATSGPPCGGRGTCVPTLGQGAGVDEETRDGGVRGYPGPPYQCTSCLRGTSPSFWDSTPNQTCSVNPAGGRKAIPEAQALASPEANKQRMGVLVGVAVGIITVFLVLAALMVLWCWTGRRRRQNEELAALSLSRGEPELQGLRQFTLAELQSATGNFAPGNKLGSGNFGEVYWGILPQNDPHLPNCMVAVKRQVLDKVKFDEAAITKSFLNEAKVLSSAHHKHLVALRGCCVEEEQLVLVLDFVPNGNLREMITKDAARVREGGGAGKPLLPKLTWERRVRLALGAARGLNYLHNEVTPAILHLDFKSENLLVDHEFNARVSDFGIAKVSMETTEDPPGTLKTQNYRGTPGYIDPFFYADPTLTKKSDVYSFGVVLLELATDWAPLQDSSSHILNRVLSAVKSKGFLRVASPSLPFRSTRMHLFDVESGKHGCSKVSPHLFKRFVCLALWCCAFNRAARPTMQQVVKVLVSIAEGHERTGEESCILLHDGQVNEQVYSIVSASSRRTGGTESPSMGDSNSSESQRGIESWGTFVKSESNVKGSVSWDENLRVKDSWMSFGVWMISPKGKECSKKSSKA